MTITTGALKILFVLTSHSQMGDTGHKTGFWVEEFANPYYTLVDQGVDITIATPKGGAAPIDPTSSLPQNATEDTKRFNEDAAVQKKINETIALADVNFEDYDAVFYPGGHGPLWDLAEDATSAKLIQDFNAAKKPIAFVCHAPAALRHVKNAQGEFLVKGKKVTGFTNEEEEAVQLTKVVPFLVEDMLKENGGIYSKGDNWATYAVQDGNLITGQNPASSALVAEMLLKMLEKK
ncbi:type 1 glutamine amidotransferase domain-containing protein [Labilibaculum sp. A4]|uniref:type 1 glutamine amidotransferase domain-containing protein n=1 Tax=Labilibaculum euxinus TaxID=2686357 RepID=UPI000F628709|nr:type 1 glutamine amidotransferase domain-containing protein [Labilibaculum euxinus]MDQ1772099.1 type 1 glutamine amidotransferase domain-containing protein [Labilibaculum euxinus]MWN75595.1 type 1 glutamine amidotransferase domain-containing protein [Labilibaculum euxinus]